MTLVLGSSSIRVNRNDIAVIPVTSADDMYNAVMSLFPSTDIAVLAAAVADFKPKIVSDSKIKKDPDVDELVIHLVKNKDILKTLGEKKTITSLLSVLLLRQITAWITLLRN